MKKLLIAMSAAAMFSLCAKADTTPTLLGSMDFESYEVGAPITTAQEGGLQFWTNASVGTTNETVNVGGESQIAVEGDGESANKYLKVDTTETLVRQTAELNASEIAPVSTTNADVIVSAKVQFTAADDAPEAAEGDKLIVWAKAPDENDPQGTTNLMVMAKTVVGENTIVTNFVTDTHVDAETWYDLEIKAVATGSVDEGDPSVAFTVSIARSGSGLTPAAVTVDGQATTFKSLLATSDPAAQTIASIGFKGTGAVDDIVFAKKAAEKFKVTVSAPGVVGTDYGMGDDLVGLAEFDVGTTEVEIYVLATADKTITCNISGATIGATPDSDGFRTVTIPTASVAANATVEVTITVTAGGGTDVPEIVVPEGGTVAGVIAAATSETGIPLANVTAASQVVIDNANHTVKVGDAVPVSIAAFYTASFDFDEDSTKIVLTLNDAALTTAGTMVEVSVDTAFGLKVSASNEKLYYGLSSSATVKGTYVAPAAKALTKGTGNALTLSAAKGEGSACFYKLYVTDVLPNE